MNLNSFRYCLRQGAVSLQRNFWLAMVTASMIAVSIAIFGVFLLLSVNVGQVMQNIAGNVEIAVFLEDRADTNSVLSAIRGLSGVAEYTFVSREQGLVNFGQTLGEKDLFSVLAGENNPLPDMFRVRTLDATLVPTMAAALRKVRGVEAVDYGEDLVAQLLNMTRWLNSMFLAISLFLGLGATLLIVTIIRLSVMARQEEIGVMKYLGASNWYIRLPFILEGATMGLLGSLLATLSLGAVYFRLTSNLQNGVLPFLFRPVTEVAALWPMFSLLLLLGFFLGIIGSLLSVRKYLREVRRTA